MKKLTVGLLVLALVITLFPASVLAADAAWIGTTGYATLEDAVNAAKSGDTITLSVGNYTLYKKGATTKGKDLTFVGQGAGKTVWGIGATLPDPAYFGTEYNGDYSFDGAGTVTFKNMTLQSGTVDYLGFIRADKTVVEDCTITGKTFYWGYTSATFRNTKFVCPSGDYAIWTYSSPVMTFDTCTFESSGKVINVYTDFGAGKNDITVNFMNCKVNNTGISLKPTLNINDSNMGNFKYILNISANATKDVTGVATDKITCSRVFGFGGKKGNNTGRTIVNMGGKTVWQGGKWVDHSAFASVGYTDGELENNYTVNYGPWVQMDDGTRVRTYKKICNYCEYSEEGQETEKPAPVVPKTGDDTPIGLYALCGLAALAGAVLLTKKRKAKA